MTPRRGLVLGGGGVLGAAWMVGALTALEAELGVDVRDFDELVGTSAGAVLAGLLGAGVPVADLLTHQLAGTVDAGPLSGYLWDYDKDTGGDRPGLPKVGLGSRELLRRNALHLRHLPPTAVLSAILPEGRGSIEAVGAMVGHVVPQGWPSRPGVTVVALDYDTGERVAFGREGAPEVDLPAAVMASCAIPGWYQPVRIGDHRYIDGGAWSSTNLDLMAGLGLDEVYVLAPQVSFVRDAPRHWRTRVERQWRNRVTLRVLRELAKVHADGAEVTVLGPGEEDLEAIGSNLMDVTRRPTVIATSLRTSAVALHDPAPLPDGSDFEEVGDANLPADDEGLHSEDVG
ncbi:NTE family protein [Pedococcus dokdonensis]|uniref:NTE family protein n=1 Tax=Pedococcus dokdonensis TaxID=443156 RepID=A0A1H0R6C1_9MICO|nr:patatin-like phospholipase family protein [Pedococcus dokdonensis]SDP25037.1 NTE family protein [Pedococcus dokdonensis]